MWLWCVIKHFSHWKCNIEMQRISFPPLPFSNQINSRNPVCRKTSQCLAIFLILFLFLFPKQHRNHTHTYTDQFVYFYITAAKWKALYSQRIFSEIAVIDVASLKLAQEGNINLKHPLNSHLVIKIIFFLIGAMYDFPLGFSCMSVIRGTFFVGKKVLHPHPIKHQKYLYLKQRLDPFQKENQRRPKGNQSNINFILKNPPKDYFKRWKKKYVRVNICSPCSTCVLRMPFKGYLQSFSKLPLCTCTFRAFICMCASWAQFWRKETIFGLQCSSCFSAVLASYVRLCVAPCPLSALCSH